MAALSEAPPIPETPKKKQQRKPRNNSKKKDDTASFNSQQLTALIVSISTIFAARPGLEMFAISEMEAQQIANPLANIIAKNESLNGLSEHADAIALVTACFVVIAPRLMLYFEQQKQKKLQAAGGMKLVRTDKNESGQGGGSAGKPSGTRPQQPANDADGIFAAIPALL